MDNKTNVGKVSNELAVAALHGKNPEHFSGLDSRLMKDAEESCAAPPSSPAAGEKMSETPRQYCRRDRGSNNPLVYSTDGYATVRYDDTSPKGVL